MASQMLGRCACPECGFHAAHVKINIDKEGKHPYRHCPECSAQYFAKNKFQGDMLLAKIRQGEAPAINTPPASEVAQPSAIVPTAEAVAPAPVPAAPKRKLVLGVMVPA